jgi:hypothetical protein
VKLRRRKALPPPVAPEGAVGMRSGWIEAGNATVECDGGRRYLLPPGITDLLRYEEFLDDIRQYRPRRLLDRMLGR